MVHAIYESDSLSVCITLSLAPQLALGSVLCVKFAVVSGTWLYVIATTIYGISWVSLCTGSEVSR